MKITEADRTKIQQIIKTAEEKTSGEFVPVVLQSSDHYPAAHYRLASICAVITSLLTYKFISFEDPIILIWATLTGLLSGYLLGYLPWLKMLFTTKEEVQEETYQRALQSFFELGVTNTKRRTGVMIYLSILERKVFIFADAGINQVVPANYWDEQVQTLIASLKEDNFITGLQTVITQIGEKLNTNFPITDDDTNELENRLVTD